MSLLQLRRERDRAMQRARCVRDNGWLGYAVDVSIARRVQRELLRRLNVMRGAL